MSNDQLGKLFAVSTAVLWAFALLFFKRSGDTIHPLALNLFKNTVAIILLAVTQLVRQDGFRAATDYSSSDILMLTISGIIGLAICDTLLFYALNLLNVSILVIVDCLYSPFMMLFAWAFLKESLTWQRCLGAAMILTAVVITLGFERPKDKTARQIAAGVAIGVISIICLVVGIVLMKPILKADFASVVWASQIRLAAGTSFLALFALALPSRRKMFSVFKPSPGWKLSLPGAFLGSYLCLLLWLAGFAYGDASDAAILNQTHTIFGMLLAAWVLKEKLTARKIAAVTLAMAGVVLVSWNAGGKTPASQKAETALVASPCIILSPAKDLHRSQ